MPHVTLPYITKEGAGGPPQPGFFGGYLGQAYDPLFRAARPNAADFAVPELTLMADVSLARLSSRQTLFHELDRQFASPAGRLLGGDGRFPARPRTVDLRGVAAGFRLSEEPDNVRESYGRNIYGQSVLLARRLIEAGTRMVTISWAPDANATWDTHGDNFKKLKNTLLPQFDAACSSLIADLAERGHARAYAGGGAGRFWPDAQDQQCRCRPRSLELLLQPDADRRRINRG